MPIDPVNDAPVEYDPDEAPVAVPDDPDAPVEPVYEPIQPNDQNTYHVGQDCSIRNQFYEKGAQVQLTPDELATVQAVDLQFYHPVGVYPSEGEPVEPVEPA